MGSTSLQPPTAEELVRWAAILALGLDAATGEACSVEIHHLLSPGGLRLGHRFTVGLSKYSHAQVKTRTFKKHYPDAWLLKRQDELIGWAPVVLPAKRARNPARSRCTAAANQVKRPAGGFA
jgi:hypothetical protein